MAGAVDLHSHTTASDGSFTPRELVREAARRGVRVLALTDHDSTEGLAEAIDEAAAHAPLQIVPGIEINCDVDGGEVHVLGYCLDYEAPWFQEFCRGQRAERRQRVHRMVTRLAELGMPIDAEEVFTLVQEGLGGARTWRRCWSSYVKMVREAFDRPGRGQARPRAARKLSPVEAVRLIRRAGGPVFPSGTRRSGTP
jgi:hypothetical protein